MKRIDSPSRWNRVKKKKNTLYKYWPVEADPPTELNTTKRVTSPRKDTGLPGKFRPVWNREFDHSERSDSTGFAMAARIAWELTETRAISKTTTPLNTNGTGVSAIL
jgi:hypothetical protein